MRINSSSALFDVLKGMSEQSSDGRIIPYIDRFLTVHPYAGIYQVDDSQYQSSESDPRKKHFHPSGDCLKCQMLLYYERMCPDRLEPEVISPRLQRIFKTGTAMHSMIQSWFAAMSELDGFPTLVGNEVRVRNKDWNIGGYIDSVVKMPGSEDPVCIEIKTINTTMFKALSAPKPEHRLQVGCYIMELDSPYGIVLYIDKNTCDMKEFRVESMDMMGILSKWSEVRLAVDAEDPSKLMFGCKPGSKEWEKCPARHICHRG